jgi:GNAT superfamily N-acetyltransferase
VFSTWHGEDFLHLDCLYLVESARGLGAGGMLVKAVRAFALSAGLKWLEWQTPIWNTSAILFYEKIGAAATTKQRFTLRSRS